MKINEKYSAYVGSNAQQQKNNCKQDFLGNKISRENANQIKETKNCW